MKEMVKEISESINNTTKEVIENAVKHIKEGNKNKARKELRKVFKPYMVKRLMKEADVK